MPETASSAPGKNRAQLSLEQFEALLAALRGEDWRLAGPSVKDGALVHEDISGVADLPRGWTEGPHLPGGPL
jgi:sulfhydrogenase subunit beta (sulfur reductase)